MNRRALLFSAVTGLAGIILMQLYIRRLEYEISGGAAISVLVANQDLLPGVHIDGQMLGIRDVPQAYLDQRHIPAKDVEKVTDAKVTTEVRTNECLLWTDIEGAQRKTRNLSSLVQEGMRAIAVESTGSTFSGLIRPGDRVDVMFTEGAQIGLASSQATHTILQNIIVLAVGSNTGDPYGPNDDEQNSSDRVTLSVSIEQGQLLTQAEHQGELKLILRNPDDIILLENIPKTSRAEIADTRNRSRLFQRVSSNNAMKEIDHVR